MKARATAFSFLVLGTAAAQGTLEVPAGSKLEIRLAHSVTNTVTTPGGSVETTVIAPVLAAGRVAIPAGRTLRGTVKETGSLQLDKERRPRLLLVFGDLADGRGGAVSIAARVVDADARQEIDGDGRLIGPPPLKGQPSAPEQRIPLAADLNPFALGLMDAEKRSVHSVIMLERGVELTLALTEAAKVPAPALAGAVDLRWLAATLPIATRVGGGTADATPTNVVFVGSRGEIATALQEAGWASHGEGALSVAAEAFGKVVATSGYKSPGPTELENRMPDAVFEKQANSLAKGRRLTLWSRPVDFEDRKLWVGTAERVNGIEVRKAEKALFLHVHPRLDDTRAKLVSDLQLTGRVKSVELVDRENAPRTALSPAGDALETDGRIAVIVLK